MFVVARPALTQLLGHDVNAQDLSVLMTKRTDGCAQICWRQGVRTYLSTQQSNSHLAVSDRQ